MNEKTTPSVAVMLTLADQPEAMAIVAEIAALPEQHQAEGNAIRDAAIEQIRLLDERFTAQHRAAWDRLQLLLGLPDGETYAVCTDHVERFGVAFLTTEADAVKDEDSTELPSGLAEVLGKGGIGGALLRALKGRGRIVAGDEHGGIIEVDMNDINNSG